MRRYARSRNVKQILPLLTGIVVAGCCSTQNDFQHLSTSDLQLRRYELLYCLSMTRTSLDNRPSPNNGYEDVNADLEEKAAIEAEISRRGVTAYHRLPWVTEQYVRDHCHCRHWVVNL